MKSKESEMSRREFLKSSAQIALFLLVKRAGGDEIRKHISGEREAQFLLEHPIKIGRSDTPNVIVTYDDGYDNEAFKVIIDAFDKYEAKCTFFVIGKHLKRAKEGIRMAVNHGHEIGCHSYTHSVLPQLSSKDLKKEFERYLDEFSDIVPGYKMRFFRAPYGSINERVLTIAATFGLQHVGWNVESGGIQPNTFDILFKNFASFSRYSGRSGGRGIIVLSHASRYFDIRSAEKIVSEFIKRGLIPVSISEGMKPEDDWELKRKREENLVRSFLGKEGRNNKRIK